MTFEAYLFEVAQKKAAMSLGRLMTNLSGPSASRRKILMTIAYLVVLYAAPVWVGAIGTQNYRDVLTKA